jgi:polar amino acid transport system substrate-binding protein
MARKIKRFFSVELIIFLALVLTLILSVIFFLLNIEHYDYIIETNAFFAPFEYYSNREIKGVDVDIIDRVAEKMDKTIQLKNVEFDVIIDNVSDGIIADAGAAGLTITEPRLQKVDFSIPYYTSVQYVIFSQYNLPNIHNNYLVWEDLAGKTLGSQTGCTGYLFMSDEVDSGVLEGTDTKIKGFDSHQIAADAIGAHLIDYAIADELAAKFIVEKNPNLATLPLYYSGTDGMPDEPAEESYAIAVNKNRPELLSAINEVLTEMLEPGEDGKSEIDKLILKHMGLTDE